MWAAAFFARLFFQCVKHRTDICIDADGFFADFPGRTGLPQIDANIRSIRPLRRHTPEGVFDDCRGVVPCAQLQKECFAAFMAAQESAVALGGGVPALVLDKGIVAPQIHRHRLAADRATRHKLARHTHIMLLLNHPADDFLIVIGFLAARLTALEQAVIALCVEQAALVKARLLEAMVYVCGQDEIILILNQFQ